MCFHNWPGDSAAAPRLASGTWCAFLVDASPAPGCPTRVSVSGDRGPFGSPFSLLPYRSPSALDSAPHCARGAALYYLTPFTPPPCLVLLRMHLHHIVLPAASSDCHACSPLRALHPACMCHPIHPPICHLSDSSSALIDAPPPVCCPRVRPLVAFGSAGSSDPSGFTPAAAPPRF